MGVMKIYAMEYLWLHLIKENLLWTQINQDREKSLTGVVIESRFFVVSGANPIVWEYQNTSLGACLNLPLAAYAWPGEFNEVLRRYERGPMCSLAAFLSHFLSLSLFSFLFSSFLYFAVLSFSFLSFPVLSFFSFLFLFFPFLRFLSFSSPFLSLSFFISYFLLDVDVSAKCNSMTAPVHVNARWSDFTWSFPQANRNIYPESERLQQVWVWDASSAMTGQWATRRLWEKVK